MRHWKYAVRNSKVILQISKYFIQIKKGEKGPLYHFYLTVAKERYVYMCVCTDVCVQVCVCVQVYRCVCVCVQICVCV